MRSRTEGDCGHGGGEFLRRSEEEAEVRSIVVRCFDRLRADANSGTYRAVSGVLVLI